MEIYGEVTDNLYNQRMSPIENDKYQNLVIREGTVTRHETIYLSAGNEYSFSLLPAESVSITVMPSTDKVELTTYQQGKEKKYSVDRANKLGLSLIFQHR
ncbi:MAG: hypothetical protein LBB43_03630 [Spirochaetaceae bacterium]|nr:hypothetical protein [Spirochaetaceae bacterium]